MKPSLPRTLLLSVFFSSTLISEEITFNRAHELIRSYCVECHNPAKEKGGLDLAVLESEADFLTKPVLLEDLEWVIAEREMPPSKAEKHPTDEQRKELTNWLEQELMKIRNARPNDPGSVVMPRISSKEFDYVIEDLTGKSYDLSQFLTVDTAAGEGFYNVGAGQQLSVGQFESFMTVSKMLMAHSRYVPGMGIWWMDGPQPQLESDEELADYLRNKLNRLVERGIMPDLNEDHVRQIKRKTAYETGLGAYLEAAWQFRYRSLLGLEQAGLKEIATGYDPVLYPSGLEKMVAILGRDKETPEVLEWRENPVMAEIVRRWLALPEPATRDLKAAHAQILEIDKWVDQTTQEGGWSGGANWREPRAVPLDVPPADSPERQQRRGFYHRGKGYLKIDASKITAGSFFLAATGQTFPGDFDPTVIWTDGVVTLKNGRSLPWDKAGLRLQDPHGRSVLFQKEDEKAFIKHTTPGYVEVFLPEDTEFFEVNAMYDSSESAQARLLRVMPLDNPPGADDMDRFYERSVIGTQIDDEGVKRAVKWIGSVRSFSNDNFLPYRFSKNEIFDLESETVRRYLGLQPLEESGYRHRYWGSLYAIPLEKLETIIREAVHDPKSRKYRELRQAIRAAAAAQDRPESEAKAEKHRILEDFAKRAWRQAPTPEEIDGLVRLAETEVADGNTHEASLEVAMRAVLISPKFLYRFTESRQNAEPYPISGPELATKLAAVLWVGLPDEELLALGNNGSLPNPQILSVQIDRMLADPRADRFIEEFFGRWLHFAEFDTFSGPDAEKFKDWNKDLARHMHEEATLFVKHLVREDQPLTDLFSADYTFLNAELAEHYGIEGIKGEDMRLVRVGDAPRGGILGMGAFLTQTSSPLRTSPVHRGLWLYEDVLNLPVPEPPPVPLLSDDGVDEQGRGIVEQLRQHRDDPACYSCHDRFDPMGVALENFDPIGRWRSRIENRADVESKGLFRNGTSIDGIAGLREYLKQREDNLLEAFTSKLLGYSLGRSVLPTDEDTLEKMQKSMHANGLSPRAAVKVALTSPQFLQRRDTEMVSQ